MKAIDTIKIHPAIGIARIGNSPTGFFIGPELPGKSKRPTGGYKDSQGRIKRQAARFRLFGYDANGKPVREISAKDAAITWTVHLANKKAAWKTFDGLNPNSPPRNAGVADRSSLVIDPGPRSLSRPNMSAQFDNGKFLGMIVTLGEMRTDAAGRLLVLGGFGNSASPANKPLPTFANNDGWQDDVSDGPVTACVTLKANGQTIQAIGAWVICPPPDFAPPISHVITLYDTLLQVAVEKLGLKLPAKPSFTRDIYPILRRAIDTKWVSKMVADAHAHVTLDSVIPPPGDPVMRKAIFKRLRNPSTAGSTVTEGKDMPMVHSDYYPADSNEPLTKIQYRAMKKWKDGNFVSDWPGPPKQDKVITPAGLDRAALEACVGGAFYPGIEASWLLRDSYNFIEPFRLDPAGLQPGDVTKQMAVPWQADFNDCTQDGALAWWPAQRPDDVFPAAGGGQVSWVRDLVSTSADMVANWHRLGFVVTKGSKFLETERS
jgi:hypothetical protein